MAAPMAGTWELKTAALIRALAGRAPAGCAGGAGGGRGLRTVGLVFRGPERAVAGAPAADHHVAVLLFAQAGHAAGHLLEALAVGGADLGQEVDVAAQAQAL